MSLGQKYRVLICSNAYPPNFIGGAELIAHFQAKALQELGHEPVIFAGDPSDSNAGYAMRKDSFDNLPVYRIRLSPADYSHHYVNFSHPDVERHFLNVLRDVEPHIVHFHNIIGLSLGLIDIAKAEGIKTVLTVHDHWGFCLKNTLLKSESQVCTEPETCVTCLPFVDDGDRRGIPVRMRKDFVKRSLSAIDAFISPSRYLGEAYIRAGFAKERFHFIWYGIDTERFGSLSKQPSEFVRFTFIGFLGRHKGVHVLLSALQMLETKGNVRVNIVGVGDEEHRCRSQVKEAGLTQAVRFWGKVDNDEIEKVYEETDVFVLPSIWPENQPVTITEALASGTAVIGSRLGGITEMIQDGETGYLFEAGNAEDLARKMKLFIDAPGKIAEFGTRGRERNLSNTFKRSAEKTVSLYDQVIEGVSWQGEEEKIVVCCGRRVGAQCAAALERFREEGDGNRHRFIMGEWLSEDILHKAALLWVVDGDYDRSLVSRALKNRIPLLVPEHVPVLKELCLSSNCGLYYRDTWTAQACLAFLLNNEDLGRQMGANGSATASWCLA